MRNLLGGEVLGQHMFKWFNNILQYINFNLFLSEIVPVSFEDTLANTLPYFSQNYF